MSALLDKETSQRLKTAGFNVPVANSWHYFPVEDGSKEMKYEGGGVTPQDWNAKHKDDRFSDIVISRPTADEAANWLRTAKGLHISVRPATVKCKWTVEVIVIDQLDSLDFPKLGPTYSECQLAGIKAALLHIENNLVAG